MAETTLKLFAICWQDTSEPWGWAPDVPEADGPDDAPPQAFFWNREEAEAALAEHVRVEAPKYRDQVNRFWAGTPSAVARRPFTLDDAREQLTREHSVQEYDVPVPPIVARLVETLRRAKPYVFDSAELSRVVNGLLSEVEKGDDAGPQRRYSDVAGPNVPTAQRMRRDRLLYVLRDCAGTVPELMQRMEAAGEARYNYDLCTGDLRQLERYGLARSTGHPKEWSARG